MYSKNFVDSPHYMSSADNIYEDVLKRFNGLQNFDENDNDIDDGENVDGEEGDYDHSFIYNNAENPGLHSYTKVNVTNFVTNKMKLSPVSRFPYYYIPHLIILN